VCSFIIPVTITTFLFNEPFWYAYHWHIARYVITLHITWSINSVSHLWGDKPFEKDIMPTDTYLIGFCAFGEGWHNYHHVYPFDYKVSELPRYWCNFTIAFIDFFAMLGWAYDLKTVSDEMIKRRVLRTGDGTHRYSIEAAKLTNKQLLDAYNQNNNNCSAEDQSRLAHKQSLIREHYWGYGDEDMLEEDISLIETLHTKAS